MSGDDRVQAFRSYDFDGDQKWLAYLNNVEIATADREAAINKLKAKWYKKNIDSDFDIATATPTPKPTAQAAGTESSYTSSRPQPSSTDAPPPRASSRPAAAAAGSGPQKYLFPLHLALLVTAVLYLQPLNARLSYTSFSYFIKLAAAIHAIKVYTTHGLPKLSLASLKDYGSRAFMTTDFQYLLLALLFLSGPPQALLTVPFCVLGAYHVCAHAEQQYRHTQLWRSRGERLWAWMRLRQREALVLCALSEIMLAMSCLLLVVTSLGFLPKAYMMWSMLKLRYWSPDAQVSQRAAWGLLDERTRGVRARVPVVGRVVGWVQRWFLSLPGRAA